MRGGIHEGERESAKSALNLGRMIVHQPQARQSRCPGLSGWKVTTLQCYHHTENACGAFGAVSEALLIMTDIILETFVEKWNHMF